MLDPVTAIHGEIEEQPFKYSSPLEMGLYTLRYHSTVLRKLQNLPDNGLGNENESRQDLINMHKEIVNKFNKTVAKLYGFGVSFAVTLGTSHTFIGKKDRNLLKSADYYHNWIRTIDRQIDAFQNRNQGQTGTW